MDVVGYVNSINPYMKGKKNVCTVPVHNLYEESIISGYIKSRGDRRDIRFSKDRPATTDRVLVSDLPEWRKTAAKWYLDNSGVYSSLIKIAKAMLED